MLKGAMKFLSNHSEMFLKIAFQIYYMANMANILCITCNFSKNEVLHAYFAKTAKLRSCPFYVLKI